MLNMLKVCAAAATVLAGGAMLSQRAEAMPIAPAPLASDAGLVTQVQYGCPRVWRCGPYGCGWRRVCYGGPVYPYYGYRPYRPYYGYRSYWRYGYRPFGPRWGYRRW
jgi:hypothetical protein